MTRRILALALVLATLVSCVSSQAAPQGAGTQAPAGATGVTPTASTTPAPPAVPPAPDAEIPPGGAALAVALTDTYETGRAAIDGWLAVGDPGTWPPPRDVVLFTLYEQRIGRLLSAHPKLAGRVIARLADGARAETIANVAAGRALFEHFTPVRRVPDFRIRHPEPADALLGYFREGEERFEVDWEVLAAIMLVETRMGRIRSSSSAGAQGPMQFLPSTWAVYGLGGDVHDAHDAVLGAANYLAAHGAPDDYRAAIYAYNPVNAYVTAVWRYATRMMRSPDSYYAYYNWQVFVRTTRGDVRLSGPGL